jgi:transcriptional regulator with XRE-family HTH domain
MVRTVAAASDEFRDFVGAEVRSRRLAAGLSVAEVARRADVSAPFISQLETGRTSMSIPTLYRIATALGCTPNALLGGATPAGSHLTRAGDGIRLSATDGTHSQRPRLISRTGPGVLLQAYHYVINPGDDPQEWYEHDGEDIVYVVRGSLDIEFGDGSRVALDAGDSLHHDGTTPHRWILRGDDEAEAVIVVGDPRSHRA